jgi:enoyl-CoA hydratase/carnithine racemase
VAEVVQLDFPSDGVARILQNTGPHNFSTFEANEQLLAALERARDEGARVVVVGSSLEGHFAGHGWLPDVIETFTGGTPSGDPLAGWRGFTELDTGPMVSIAAVDGAAWGHGAELAWACDLRVASTRATFGQPEVNIGVCPGSGGTVRLARLVGEATALRLVLDGRPIDSAEAFRLGLIHRLVDSGQSVAEALKWAQWLATRPPGALAACKRAIKGARGLPFDEALRHEGTIFIDLLGRAETIDRLRVAQARYDDGADIRTAFGVPRSDEPNGITAHREP